MGRAEQQEAPPGDGLEKAAGTQGGRRGDAAGTQRGRSGDAGAEVSLAGPRVRRLAAGGGPEGRRLGRERFGVASRSSRP